MQRDYILPNRAYDFLKWLVQVILPGLGALYFALSGTWDLPKGDEVVATAAAVAAFLGLFLKASDISYNRSDAKFDGALNVEHSLEYLDPDDDEPARVSKYGLVGDMTPEELADKSQILFKVNHIEK